MTIDEMKILAGKTVAIAASAGAETVEVGVTGNNRFSVTVRNGSIENLSESGSSRIGITLSIDKKKSTVTSSDLSEEQISRLIKESVELASVMDRDDYFGLPAVEELGVFDEDLGIFDEATTEVPAGIKIEKAIELEKSALAIDPRIISDGASVSTGDYSFVHANSLGFCEGYRQTYSSIDISCAVEDKPDKGENTGKKQSSYWYSASTSLAGLDPVEEVASRAVERTMRKLGAVKPKTCEVPVIFDQVTARNFLGSIASAIGGGNIYKRSSFLADSLGKKVSSSLLSIVDDPLMKGRLGSRPFDSEGVRVRRNMVIENGVLSTYLLDTYQARKLSLSSTGSGGGISNFFMVPGESSLEEIIGSIDDGLYLTALSGPGANWSSGDFSQGGQGIWISKGRLSHPVNEFTITSTFDEILKGIVMVGNRFEWKGSIASPPFKTRKMTISGT